MQLFIIVCNFVCRRSVRRQKTLQKERQDLICTSVLMHR